LNLLLNSHAINAVQPMAAKLGTPALPSPSSWTDIAMSVVITMGVTVLLPSGNRYAQLLG
jgi:hypothetical protein